MIYGYPKETKRRVGIWIRVGLIGQMILHYIQLFHIMGLLSDLLKTNFCKRILFVIIHAEKELSIILFKIYFFLQNYFRLPSPPIILVISSIRSMGKGGELIGFMAMDISFMGLSSAATRLELKAPHTLHL